MLSEADNLILERLFRRHPAHTLAPQFDEFVQVTEEARHANGQPAHTLRATLQPVPLPRVERHGSWHDQPRVELGPWRLASFHRAGARPAAR